MLYAIKKCCIHIFLIACDMCSCIRQVVKDSFSTSVQVIPMCLLWVATTLWGHPMQVVGLQLMVAKRWNDLSSSNQHNSKLTQQHTNNWEASILVLQCIFSQLLMSSHLDMDEFTILFRLTNNTSSLLEISPNVHVYTLLQCW